jgi:hypothetical protein
MSTPTKMSEPSPVQYAGLSIPLETFNSWVRSPAELQLTIGCFQTLHAQPFEQALRVRGEQALIRDMSEELLL